MNVLKKQFYELNDYEVEKWRQFTGIDSNFPSPFFQYEFAQCLDNAQVDVYVYIWYENDVIIALLPLQFRNFGYKLLGFPHRLGEEMSDYFGILTDIKPSCFKGLMEACPVEFLKYSHLPALIYNSDNSEKVIASQIDLQNNDSSVYFNWLNTTNKKFYKDTLRRKRKLEEEVGEINYKFHSCNNDSLNELILNKRKQYLSTGVEDSLSDDWKRQVLQVLRRDFNNPKDSFHCVLSELYVGDQWLAFHFGIQCNGILQYWFPVYNPEFKKYAPGRLLLFKTIEQANINGIKIIDRGEGFSDSKKDTANVVHYMNKGEYTANTLRGYFNNFICAISWRLKHNKLR